MHWIYLSHWFAITNVHLFSQNLTAMLLVCFQNVISWKVDYFAMQWAMQICFWRTIWKFYASLHHYWDLERAVLWRHMFNARQGTNAQNALMVLLFANVPEHLLLSRGVTKLFSISLTLKEKEKRESFTTLSTYSGRRIMWYKVWKTYC